MFNKISSINRNKICLYIIDIKENEYKKKAQDILNGFDKYIPSIEEYFIIYKCNKMLENDLINIEKQDN